MPVNHGCAGSPEDHSRVISGDETAGMRLQSFFVWRARAPGAISPGSRARYS
jgi:hypothetical protein